jgi:hypothetical protein
MTFFRLASKNTSFLIALFVAIGSLAGCTGAPEPDLDRLRTELDTMLQANVGNDKMGNADIYRIMSLEIGANMGDGQERFSIQFIGDMECLRGFYMFADGRYTFSKPKQGARWHVTKGNVIGFTGTMDFELTGKAWTKTNHNITMNLKYAPPV